MYVGSWSVPTDKAMALSMFEKAGEQGLPEAQYNAGLMYREKYLDAKRAWEKEDEKRYRSEALKWLQMAADQGYRDALDALWDL